MTEPDPTNVSYRGRSIRLVLDRSFFHDALRTDYPHTEHAKWLFSYLVNRKAIDPRIICYTSSLILRRLWVEFTTYPEIRPQTIMVLQALIYTYDLPTAIRNFDWSTLYVAKMLFDTQFIPVILTSVKAKKWRERTQGAGIELGLDEFTEVMSEKRIEDNAWYAPSSVANFIPFLARYDPLYESVVSAIEPPPSLTRSRK